MFFLYLVLWLILSMQLSVHIMAVGVLVSVAVYWFACTHMRYRHTINFKTIIKLFLGIRYVFVLVWETAKANMAVFNIVFGPTVSIKPRIIYFRSGLKTNVARVVLANSMTLTPGTVTVCLTGDLFCVHCLDAAFAENVKNSIFLEQLRNFERRY